MPLRSSLVAVALRAARWLDRSGLRRLGPVRRLVRVAGRWIFPSRPALPGRAAAISHGGVELEVPHATAGPYSRNDFEPLTARFIERSIRPGAVVVDVGANVGFHTVRMALRAGPDGRVYALEPAADNLAYLRHNLDRNLDRAHRAAVTVVPAAAAAERGRRDFFLQSKGTHHGFFDRSDTRGDRVTVETAPLDDLVKGPVDFVKIDTEGAEMEVLDGMSRILADSPELRMVAEWNLPLSSTAEAQTAELDALPRRLESLGFTVTVLDEEQGVATTVDEVMARLREGTFGHPRVVNLLARRAPRPLRVLHLIKGLGRGGAERLLVDGLRHADRERFEYAYGYFLPAKDQLAADLEALGAPVLRFGARTSAGVLLEVPAVRRYLESWGADVVHCHLPVSGVAGRIAAGRVDQRAGIPVVYTEHNLIERYHPLTRWANLATWRRQARVVAVSEEVATSIRRHAGEAVPVEVVVNGVDRLRFRPDPKLRRQARELLGIPAGAPVIGQVAVFRPQKRLDLWLEAAARVRKQRPDARFVLVGDGPQRRGVERRADRLGLAGSLFLPGLQEDVRSYYAALDLYLVSSDYEGLPVALLEAMASGLAVVSTAVGGVPEVVRPGYDGLLVPAGDPEALAAAVLRLLDEPGERERLGASARERVAKSFSTERMAGRLEAIYDAVAGDRR